MSDSVPSTSGIGKMVNIAPSSSGSKTCEHCGKNFLSAFNLNRHIRNNCTILNNRNLLSNNLIDRKKINRSIVSSLGDGVAELRNAFKNRIASYRFSSSRDHIDFYDFMWEVKQKVLDIIDKCMKKYHTLKVNFEIFGLYEIPEKELSDIKSFNTKNKIITIATDLHQIFEEFTEEMTSQASEFQEKDSGWTLKHILFLDVNINKFTPMSASSYIKLPKAIAYKNAVLNIYNKDNACFAWSINASIFPAEGDPQQTTSYPHYDTLLNFRDLEFPMKLKDISKFEKMNNISVNVFGLESEFRDGKIITEVVGPLHFTSDRQATHVNLLLLTDNVGNNHYCLIKDLSRLVSQQKSKRHGGLHICDGCLQSFTKIEHLKAHEKNDCNHTYTKLPSTEIKINKYGESVPENILKFINFERQIPVPFVIYADFESLLKPISHNEPCDSKSFTVKVCEHQPYSFAFYVKCNFDDKYSKFVIYRGSDAAEVFARKLDETALHLYNTHLKHVKEMLPLSDQEETEYENTLCCHICEKPFELGDIKVRDHCHLTGHFRGAAHSICNLNYKVPKFIPVFFHNLTNYDSHLFIKKLASNKESVSVIAQTKEKYISFSKSILVEKSKTAKVPDTYLRLKFVDSFRFLSKSLDKLSQSLESEQCIETRRYFENEEEFGLIRQKGVFPYNYIDSFEKLEETQLPSRDKFYNDLTNESISSADYERATKVWNTFKCKTLGEYADIYLKSDIFLLADVFENFRRVCLTKYKLDPSHFLTSPSLSWDAMLRHTHIELELLTDVDAVHFFRKGIRGGVSQCSKRKAVANNKFLPNYDSSKPTSYIMYLDATNLYGAAMKEMLPTSDFKWLEKEEIEKFDCSVIDTNSPKGYVLEVDLEYPPHLHDDHNELPLCPEQMTPPKSKNPKLIPNLRNKYKYIIHYRNLKQCLKYGMKLKKIHRILEFSQSTWLGSYIDLNTKLRNSAKNEFEKDLFKLMVNSIFGKTMENVDKRQDIKLCSCWENKKGALGARALIAKPHFKSCSIFDENLVAVQLQKLKVVYDKPLYVGFSILDISKTIIYEFLYGYIKPMYGDDAIILYTDTDSLILEIFTDNVYDDIKRNINFFDTSNYDVNNIHNMPKTISVVGKMKDEYAGRPIECFYGTGAKAYCVKAGDLMKKAKGVSRSVIKHQIDFSDYVQIVENGGLIFRKMSIFKSDLHTIHTELKNKVALSSADDKRYVIPGDVYTLAWGHRLIPEDFSDNKLDTLLKYADMEESKAGWNRGDLDKFDWDNFDLDLLDL
ncbi:hypothetical protein NQ317_008926 [Molorchus minor]|uniref:C2H2-type domain-containing protein n=1 Tax=Molorchus minor TaxID=1323400 RepID=A0ABQ9JT78_9CUCU|nr:hypothetical protein NQ317_008926 [Molorchus minor]